MNTFLSEREKIMLANYFPKILKSFVEINTTALYEGLEKIDIKKDVAEVIIRDCYPDDFSVKRAINVASVTLRLFDKLKIFFLPGVRESFIAHGFSEVIAS